MSSGEEHRWSTFVHLSLGTVIGALLTMGVFFTFAVPTNWDTMLVEGSSDDDFSTSVAFGIALFFGGIMLCCVLWVANVVWYEVKGHSFSPGFADDSPGFTDANLAVIRILQGLICAVLSTMGFFFLTGADTTGHIYSGIALIVITLFMIVLFALIMIGHYSKPAFI